MSSVEKKKKFVSIVVYLHNDERIIDSGIKFLYNAISSGFENCEFIFVDDCSEDSGVEKIKAFAQTVSDQCSISIVSLGFFHGRERSMEVGVNMAIGDFVYEFDTMNIDYPQELILQLFEKAEDGFDIVAAKPVRNSLFFSKVFYKVMNAVLPNSQKISSESFRLLSRRGINRVYGNNQRMVYRKLVYASSGLNTESIPYEGNSQKANDNKKLRKYERSIAIDTFIVFTNVSFKISLILSALMALLMLGFGIYTIIVYLGPGYVVPGWALIMGLMAAGFLGLFIISTIIIKYLDLLLKKTYNRDVNHISQIQKVK